MSTTQQLMLPNDAANYDAPKGGFSADPKVPPGSAESILLMACGTASVGRQTGQRFCAACKAAYQSIDSKRFYWCCQAHKLAIVQVVCSDSTTSHCIVCSTMQNYQLVISDVCLYRTILANLSIASTGVRAA